MPFRLASLRLTRKAIPGVSFSSGRGGSYFRSGKPLFVTYNNASVNSKPASQGEDCVVRCDNQQHRRPVAFSDPSPRLSLLPRVRGKGKAADIDTSIKFDRFSVTPFEFLLRKHSSSGPRCSSGLDCLLRALPSVFVGGESNRFF